jgi:pyruvate dehydrogenase E2 component (dihydrolipoamide acetyltransferase)
MPKPGQMTEECQLVAWHKNVGDEVRKGDVLFEIETDKSNMDVESFENGVLLARVVNEGETVPVNSVCAYVGQPGEAVPDGPRIASPAGRIAVASEVAASARPPGPVVAPKAGLAAPAGTASRLAISPRAARLAVELGLDPQTIVGSGPDGRITERDVQAAAGTGVPAAGDAALVPPPAKPTPAGPLASVVAVAVAGEEPPVPLSRMRRVIAERLTLSHTTIPQFSVTVSVDVTRLQAIREDLKVSGTRLSVTDFVLAAVAGSLVAFPDLNARTDGSMVWRRRRIHLGLAVSLPAGLVVPVIRDADRLSVPELHDRASALAAAARDGALGPDDLTGSTFTVSNLGMYGVDAFDAIINPGESAILAVASAIPTPVVLAGGIAVRSIMRLTLSADHRLVDGELGARFLGEVRRRLEDPASLRLEPGNR